MGLPDSICPLPWQNLSLDVDGTSRPCCKFAHHSEESPYQLANLKDAPLDEVWNGEGMQKLRRDLLDGVRPAECATCWDEEAVGVPSLRQTWTYRGIRAEPDYDDLTPEHPVALDLKLTNLCNLKCRICGPVASSLWMREEVEVQGEDLDPWLADNRAYFRSNKITGHDDNAAVLRSWLPHLEHVELTGGEPMMSPENRQVVESLVAEGDPARVALLVTTNATVIDERIVGPFDRFGRVTVSLSIDDVGRRLEYERAPADWSSVEANILRYAAMASDRVEIWFNCSISTLNVWYLPEIVGWYVGDARLAPIGLHLNLVHNDRHYNVRCLPEALKAEVRSRVEPLLGDEQVPEDLRVQVTEVLDFMDAGSEEPQVWRTFVRRTRERDAIREESFAEVFADYHEAMVRLGCWEAEAAVPVEVASGVRPGGPRSAARGLRRRVRRLARR